MKLYRTSVYFNEDMTESKTLTHEFEKCLVLKIEFDRHDVNKVTRIKN